MSMDQYDYVDEWLINIDLMCVICNDPYQEPVSTPCDHTFCRKCIEQWLNKNASCPTCRKRPLSLGHLVQTTRIVFNMLDRIEVRCKVCGQQGIKRGNYIRDHAPLCPKTKITCSATNMGYYWTGPRDQRQRDPSCYPCEQIRSTLVDLHPQNQQFVNQTNELQTENYLLQQQINQLDDQYAQQQVQLMEAQDINRQLQNRENQLKEDLIAITATNALIRRTVTFDVLGKASQRGTNEIPNGYAGLNWEGAHYITQQWATTNYPNTNWASIFSQNDQLTCVAYNDHGDSFIVYSQQKGDLFSLLSFEAVAIYHYATHLNIFGRQRKTRIHSTTVSLECDGIRKRFMLNWTNIDEIEFKLISGHKRNKDNPAYFAITDLQLG